MSDDLLKLEELAKAATPGPWENTQLSPTCVHFRGRKKGGFDLRGAPLPKETAAFIAAANPATVLSMVATIRALQEQLKTAREALEPFVKAAATFASVRTKFHHDNVFPYAGTSGPDGVEGAISLADLDRAAAAARALKANGEKAGT